MKRKRYGMKITVFIITCSLLIELFCIPESFANQPCFKCCGSGIWHVDNKIPCSGKNCSYCVKCDGCHGSGQISDTAKRCEDCKGLGQIHKRNKKVCTYAGCKYCAPCKSCKSRGWK